MFSRARLLAFLGTFLALAACVPPWCAPIPERVSRHGTTVVSKPRREEALLTTTPPSSASPPLRAARRFRGCNPNLLAIEEPCQTAGATSWTSDWAAPALLVPLLPAFLAGAAAALLTLHLNASPGPLTRFGRTTVSALGRLVGFAAIVGGCWGARFVYADAMAAAQRDARSLVRLRTQHLGWSSPSPPPSVVAAGAAAALFGRGAALGPSSAQIRRDRREARLMRAMTPDLVPYQVGVAASGSARDAVGASVGRVRRASRRGGIVVPTRTPKFRRQRGEEESGEDARAGAGRRGEGGEGGGCARRGRRRRPSSRKAAAAGGRRSFGGRISPFGGRTFGGPPVPRAGGARRSRGPSRETAAGFANPRRTPRTARSASGGWIAWRGRWGRRASRGEASRAELSELRSRRHT